MTPAVLAVIAAVAGPLAAYLVAAKRFSGRIESSDAAELWAESRSIRDWSQDRIRELTLELEQVRKDLTATREDLKVARARITELERTV